MIKNTFFILFVLLFAMTFISPAQEQKEALYSVSGVIDEIDGGNKSFVIVTRDTQSEKLILTDSNTSFSKNMIIVGFKDFKVGDHIVVSTKDPAPYEIKAVGIFDSETAFYLITGQGVTVDYSGKIIDIKENTIIVSTNYGEKKFNVMNTFFMKNLKEASLSDFAPGDEFYAQASFPGRVEHEPPIIEPVYFKDPISYLNDLFTAMHGPLVLQGTVSEVMEDKSTFKIGDEKVLANKHTIMLVPVGFTGLKDLKGKKVFIYSITNPIPGRTYVAAAVLLEEAVPVIRESLARSATAPDQEVTIVSERKITSINQENKTITIENAAGKPVLLNLSAARIQDIKEPARNDISLSYLKTGDTVQAEGYDTARVKTLYLQKKVNPSVSRNEFDLNVYFFTDLLGYLTPFETGGSNAYTFLPEGQQNQSVRSAESGGFSYFASGYKSVSSKTKNNLLLCSGNFLYGTPLAEATGGEAVIDCLNSLGVQAAVLGEQDFYVGKEKLLKLIEKATFPVVCANVLVQGTENLLPGVKPYVVIDYNGVKVAVIGLISEEMLALIPAEYIQGIAFNSPKAVLRNYYAKMESESDFIIIMSNQKYYDNLLLANEFENILPGAKRKPVMIISGQVRSFSASYAPLMSNDILLLEAGNKGRYFGQVSLGFLNGCAESNYAYYVHQVSPGLIKQGDPAIQAIIDKANSLVPEKYGEVLGKSVIWISRAKTEESGMGDLVTDALLEKSGADIALYNGNYLRNDIFEGDITYGLLYTVIPYDFKMTVLELTGKEIKEILEAGLSSGDIFQVAGLKMVYRGNAPAGERITELTIGGNPVSDTQVYKVATTSFLAAGGDGYRTFTKGTVLLEGDPVRDIVAKHIKKLKEVRPGEPERIFAE